MRRTARRAQDRRAARARLDPGQETANWFRMKPIGRTTNGRS